MTNDQPAASTPFTSPSREYEFDSGQNLVIGELAGAMRFVGTASVVFALVVWVVGLAILFLGNPAGLSQLVQGTLMFIIGVWTRSAARSFQLVVDTQGNDIGNMMTALGELRRLYNLQKWVLILAIALIVLAFIAGFFLAMVMGARGHG
ncbi:MAG: hypothetical protein U0234_30495 [Sandaracinus sp.]